MAVDKIQQQKQDIQDEYVNKYSNFGSEQLKEAGLIEEKPYFLRYNKEKGFIQVQEKIEIEGTSLILRPPTKQLSFNPYEFSTVEEPQKYLLLAMQETPDTLLAKIKAQVKLFNDVSDKTANLLSAYIFGSYFQDRFSTVHYLMITGANGTGKSAFGDTFECLGYRPVNVANVTDSFYFRVFGTIEYGQVTLIIEEFDRMEERSQQMAMLKVGYQPNARIPRMNADLTKMEFFYPFGMKIMIGEKSPNEDIVRGVLDRSFKINSYKGTPKYNIKEIRNPQGNKERQKILDGMIHLRKILFMYRLLHYSDPYKEIDIGIDGRDQELCKPALTLSYTLGASDETQTEIEKTYQYFLDIKNNRKGDSLEGSLYPIVVKAVTDLGKDHLSINDYDNDEPKRPKSISATDLWQQITGSLDGQFGINKDGKENPQLYYSDEFGKLYRSNVIGIIRDKYGGEKDHKEKGNNIIFNLDTLEKMKRIYENDGKIRTRLLDPDSLIHPDDLQGDVRLNESGKSNDSEREIEHENPDSLGTLTPRDGQGESVSQPDQCNKKKCPYCDHEDDRDHENKKKRKRKVKLLDTSGKNEVIAIATKEKSEVPKNSKHDTFLYLYKIQKSKDGNVTSQLTKITKNGAQKLIPKGKVKK